MDHLLTSKHLSTETKNKDDHYECLYSHQDAVKNTATSISRIFVEHQEASSSPFWPPAAENDTSAYDRRLQQIKAATSTSRQAHHDIDPSSDIGMVFQTRHLPHIRAERSFV
ncbi:MAG: hypothetical protein V8R95_02080 [Faecalibacterium sp.]